MPAEEYTKPGLEQDLQEFDYVFNHGQLTPPQSPPTKEIKPLTPSYEESSTFILPDENVVQIALQPAVYPNAYLTPQSIIVQPVVQPVVQPTYITLLPPNGIQQAEPVQKSTVDASFLTAPPTPLPDIEKELAVVDEVVRSTAQNLDSNWDQWDSETFHSEASSESFVCSSPQSTTSAEEETDDPEWQPESGRPAPGKAPKTSKRSKPYSRSANIEDKRLRKKEQNKNAATRYRQKKKAEVSEILGEEKQLEDKNAELEQKVADIKTEIKYLKGLMRDLFKAKGLIK